MTFRLALSLGAALILTAGFGESLWAALPPAHLGAPCGKTSITQTDAQTWPGLNRKARRISRKARRRTLFKTRGSALKTRLGVRQNRNAYHKDSRRGANRADKKDAVYKRHQ